MLHKRCACPDKTKCRHPYWYTFELNFQRYRRSTKTANKQTAGRVEERRRVAILEGRDENPKSLMKLSKHITDYVTHTKDENSTSYKDQAVLDRMVDVTGDIMLKDVSAFQIEKWKQKRALDVAKSTVNRELNIVRGCFTKAVEWGRLRVSPCKTVKPFKVDDQRVRVLSDEELKLVLNCPDAEVALICRTTLECLPRLSEVLNIHKSDIGPSWIEFRRKGGKVSRAAVTEELRTSLLGRAEPIDGYIFFTSVRKPPTEQAMSQRIVRALRALGIKNASHHTMRHTGVTLMLEKGINPRVIQYLAGWSSLRMLERYGHARDTEIRRAVAENARHLSAL